MRTKISILELMALLAITFFFVAQAGATTVKGVRAGSNYGPVSTFAACASGSVGFECEAFGPTSTVSFDGTDFTVSQFVFGAGGNPGTILNLVDLGVLNPNQTFTLPPSLFDPAQTEIFACGSSSLDGATAATDSLGTAISTFCTKNLLALPDLSQNGTSFTTGAGYNFTGDLVLDAPAGTPVGTPEPGTMLLLGLGLAAIGGSSLKNKFRSAVQPN
jgi:hypothetical protein